MSTQQTRGPHPRDPQLFGSEAQIAKLRNAVRDLSWLLSGGYPEKASLKLVGDRYKLTKRQRLATRRSACSEGMATQVSKTCTTGEEVAGSILLIDGFNIIITIETLISGGYLFKGRDAVIRDISGVHGSYKLLGVTRMAVNTLVKYLKEKGVSELRWYFDRPVSNSGRLTGLTKEVAAEYGLQTTAATVFNPDRHLLNGEGIVISSDSQVLYHCQRWLNLEALFYTTNSNHIIDLSGV